MESQQYNRIQMLSLVLLRVMIGWHFLYEGVAKLMKENWSSQAYLLEAKGVFTPVFQWIANTQSVLHAVDLLNMWGLTAIGLGLILGCLTRLAGVAAMFLIVLYYVCNPPWVGYYYSLPTEGNYLIVNKNLVELAALLVIVVTHSSRYMGFDRLLYKFFHKKVKPLPIREAVI